MARVKLLIILALPAKCAVRGAFTHGAAPAERGKTGAGGKVGVAGARQRLADDGGDPVLPVLIQLAPFWRGIAVQHGLAVHDARGIVAPGERRVDRKSTRLNSSH